MRSARPCLLPLPLLLLFLLGSLTTGAQQYSIKGSVTDTLNAARLKFATVTLIRAQDSIMETFTRSRDDGSFQLRTPRAGEYILMITFPSFADYIDLVSVDSDRPAVDMGTIPMVSKSHLLSEFILKQQIGAIKIKGDTTEYVADSFKVRDNATVEELLKKLPGIQVNKNGEVVAQGEKVQKILVDGEEFFTDDPAVVTKSLQAKAVDKVQVFDKKSDQAIFSGVDDGSREKTINLQLKDNMKKGYFGKLIAGGGTDGFFENQGMINAFKGKRKLSLFGIMANTGKIGLGWGDRDKFGSGNAMEMNEDGFSVTSLSSDDDLSVDWNGKFNGQGLPSAWTGGMHYSNKWMEDKLHLSGNYRFGRQNVELVGNTLTETALGDSKLYRDQRRESYNYGDRHGADLLYEWKIDTTAQLKITANASYASIRSGSVEYQSGFLNTDTLNDNFVRTSNKGTTRTVNATVLYQKKFKKQGRNMSATIEEKYREQDGSGFLYSLAHYYSGISGDSVRTIDQLKEQKTSGIQLSAKLSYTEPLSKVLFLQLNYRSAVNNNSASRLSFDRPPGLADYEVLNDTTSSNYDYNFLINAGGANLRFVFKKINFSFGGRVSNIYFSQHDNLTINKNYSFNRSYNNFFPEASFNYRIPGKQFNLNFNYNGSTRQPSMDQIQPMVQNSDPTRLVIGNAALRQEFSHNMRASFNNYKVLSGSYTYAGGGFNVVQDAISRSQQIDAGGNIVYQYINVDGNYNGWLYLGYGREIRKLNLRAGFGLNANVARLANYVNGVENINHNNAYSLSMSLDYDKEKLCNLAYRPSVSYNQNTATLNEQGTNYFTYENRFEGNFHLPFKLEIGTDIRWQVREQIEVFDRNNNVFLWNAYLARKFFKNDQLELRAAVNDILNQNLGFSRFTAGNMFTEQNYNTIRRYGMLQLIWNFTKSPATAPSQGDVLIIND